MGEKVFIKEDIFKQGPNGFHLVAYKCTSCGRVVFPKPDSCVHCYSEKMEEIELSGKGKLCS